MSQPRKKGLLSWLKSLSPRTRVILASGIIAILVVLSFFAPPERDATNVTGDTVPSTVTVTRPVANLVVNRSVTFNNVSITVTQVAEAGAFSDDRKRGGVYTVRVQLQAKSGEQAPVGIDYPSLARLVLADGQVISPKLVSIAPVVLPNAMQSGYIDFAVNSEVNLAGLALRLGSGTMLAFGG